MAIYRHQTKYQKELRRTSYFARLMNLIQQLRIAFFGLQEKISEDDRYTQELQVYQERKNNLEESQRLSLARKKVKEKRDRRKRRKNKRKKH